jgi:hypothetical protein
VQDFNLSSIMDQIKNETWYSKPVEERIADLRYMSDKVMAEITSAQLLQDVIKSLSPGVEADVAKLKEKLGGAVPGGSWASPAK